MKCFVQALIFIAGLSTMAVGDERKAVGYLQLDGGIAKFADNEINGRDVTFDDGWSVNGRVGAEKGRLAGEIEIGLHVADYSPVGDGYNPALFLTAGLNVIYKFLRLPGLDAYGSLGVGFLSDDPPIHAIQVNVHAESGVILRPIQYVQLVPHIRTIAIFGASEDELQHSDTFSQYIGTARVGIRVAAR